MTFHRAAAFPSDSFSSFLLPLVVQGQAGMKRAKWSAKVFFLFSIFSIDLIINSPFSILYNF